MHTCQQHNVCKVRESIIYMEIEPWYVAVQILCLALLSSEVCSIHDQLAKQSLAT